MYEVLNIFKWKPNPKFHQTLINFEKPKKNFKTPKKISKPQNLGFKSSNAWIRKD